MENQREMKGEGVGTASYAGPCNYYSNVVSFCYSKTSFFCAAGFLNSIMGNRGWDLEVLKTVP
jgi:hypothetical protein